MQLFRHCTGQKNKSCNYGPCLSVLKWAFTSIYIYLSVCLFVFLDRHNESFTVTEHLDCLPAWTSWISILFWFLVPDWSYLVVAYLIWGNCWSGHGKHLSSLILLLPKAPRLWALGSPLKKRLFRKTLNCTDALHYIKLIPVTETGRGWWVQGYAKLTTTRGHCSETSHAIAIIGPLLSELGGASIQEDVYVDKKQHQCFYFTTNSLKHSSVCGGFPQGTVTVVSQQQQIVRAFDTFLCECSLRKTCDKRLTAMGLV